MRRANRHDFEMRRANRHDFEMRRANRHNEHVSGPGTPECTDLPIEFEVDNLVTDTNFPIEIGTTVSVHCREGYFLWGNEEITCYKKDEFQSHFNHRPTCKRE